MNDPLSPRKFKIPLNIPMRFRGERVEFPVIAVIGFLGIFSILLFTLRTHHWAASSVRAGCCWASCSISSIAITKLPVLRSQTARLAQRTDRYFAPRRRTRADGRIHRQPQSQRRTPRAEGAVACCCLRAAARCRARALRARNSRSNARGGAAPAALRLFRASCSARR